MASKTTKTKFLKEIEALGESLRAELTLDELVGFAKSEKAKKQRISKAKSSFKFFINTYFPHYIIDSRNNEFHNWVFDDLFKSLTDKKREKALNLALAAPRANAKSTIITRLLTLWHICFSSKHYIILVMSTINEAITMLETIKAELDSNLRLAYDFPDATGEGRLWQSSQIITNNHLKVRAVGASQKLRGANHMQYRPDLIILDDLENDENVRQKSQRDKLEDWLYKTVLYLGDSSKGADIILIGTVLHYDSVLNRCLKSNYWEAKQFKAILEYPTNMHLWEQWEKLFLSHNKQDKELANQFIEDNKYQLLQGYKLLWDKGIDGLLELMQRRAMNRRAFDTEMQNEPNNQDQAFFKKLKYYTQLPIDGLVFGAIDPSMGKFGSNSDPSAILIGLYSENKLYIIYSSIQKRTPDNIINTVIQLQQQYKVQAWTIETIQFQEFLYQELLKRSVEQGISVPAFGVKPNTDKNLRIQSLEPYIASGFIQFNENHHQLKEQLLFYPEHKHDDGPDALHMLWQLVTTRGGEYKYYSEDYREHQDDEDDDNFLTRVKRALKRF